MADALLLISVVSFFITTKLATKQEPEQRTDFSQGKRIDAYNRVGKTSLTYLIAHNKPLLSPGWTVGCSVEVKLHQYKEGTEAQNTFFVEFWDVGGSNGHRNTRNVFYQPTHGIILVHDLTNRKSQVNLQKWLSEILNSDNPALQHVDVDPEQFLGSTQIPILVIGTKFDLAEEKQRKNQYRRLASSIAEQCGADEIFVNCHQARSLGPGTSNSVKLTRFFDKVIERRHYPRRSPFSERRRVPPYMLATSTPLSSNKPAQYLSPRFYRMD
ncbi:rab-like protein 3 [Choristoneura fumiferana]|uniref:rab-like protein 3 n=1 Tax=Choristoneura fumiferana TaxID=7141 RepID=UPI003D155B21